MLKNVGEKEGLDLALFGEEISMSEAARIMVEKAHARRVDSGEDQ
jgi:hypothetical protein